MDNKRKYNLLSILVAALMVFAMMPAMTEMAYADAETLQSAGNCGARDSINDACADNATYTFDEASGALVIEGSGEIGFKAFGNMADADKNEIKSITISEGITSINKNAFEGAQYCESLELPNSLLEIKSEAFYNCFKLESVELKGSLQTIGEAAFYNCPIAEVDIPASVQEFYWDAFGREPAKGDLGKITVNSNNIRILQRTEGGSYKSPSSIKTAGPKNGGYDYEFTWTTKIPGRAFSELGVGISNGNKLESVVIPETVTEIGECAFYKAANLGTVNLPEGLTAIGEYCFAESGITSVDIPDGVTEIPDYAFYNCASLNSLPVTDSVTKIGYAAFQGCANIGNVEIPASVETIGGDAFRNCGSMNVVTIKNPSCVIADDENVFNKNGSSPKIKGHAGSTAEAYAQKYGYTFEEMDPPQIDLQSLKVTIPEGRKKAFVGDTIKISVEMTDATRVETLGFYFVNKDKTATWTMLTSYEGQDQETQNGLWEANELIDNDNDVGMWYAYVISSQDAYGNTVGYWDPAASPWPYEGYPQVDLSALAFEVIQPCAEHDWGEQQIQKATPDTDGRVYKTCSVCGLEENIRVIPKANKYKLAETSFTYDGSEKKPAVTVTDAEGVNIDPANYTVAYANNTNAGTATAKVTFKGEHYEGSKSLSFRINQAANPLTVKPKTAAVRSSKLKKRNQTVPVSKVVTVSKKQGKLSYKLVGVKKAKFKKYFRVDAKTGKVTVKKKLKKGTYKLKINVTASGSSNYKKATKPVTVTIKVK